ncbi:MAG: DeoR/GlpR family DNA-binding transcription regulator [Floccifex sp.]
MKIPITKRLEEIVELLEKDGYVKAKDLSQKYQISMESIRKDLTYLEEIGIAKKEYGGARLSSLEIEKSIEFRKNRYNEKMEIAKYAVKRLKDHHVLILDTGSTCQMCTTFINRLSSMDIVTNSISAFEQLNGNIHNVFLTGGKKREKNLSVIGNWTEMFLNSIHVDICFLGTSGILDSQGPTSHSYQELSTKQKMIENSDLVFVLADSSKFQEKGFHTIASWNQIDGIITDHRLSLKLYEEYSQKVPVYMAEEIYEEDC